MSFEIKQVELLGQPGFQFCGAIDEEAEFPEIDMPGDVVIDLEAVTAINSIGIRGWISWFGARAESHFTFINCPKGLVMQMNMVEGFLPKKSKVSSLQVPFYCEDTDEEKDVLFTVGQEVVVKDGQIQLNYDKSSICGPDCEPELDVSEVKFFRFLLNEAG